MSEEPGAPSGSSPAPSGPTWYVACESRELRSRPLARTVLGRPLVLYRDEAGRPAALLDRCPHRGAPLSAGRRAGSSIECRYHGWRFDRDGRCVALPGLVADPGSPGRVALAFATLEQDDCLWVASEPGPAPSSPPPRPRLLRSPGFSHARERATFEAPLADVAENVLDVPHTAFLHGGLFRGRREPVELEVVVRRLADRVEAEYHGEPRPTGLLGRLLAPAGGVVEHTDRFLAPATCEVEYRLGRSTHLLATSFLTPESETRTRLYGVVSWRSPLPAFLVRTTVEPVARRVLEQDAEMLALATANQRRHGLASRASTELDVLGAHIRDLALRPAGAAFASGTPGERRLRLRI